MQQKKKKIKIWSALSCSQGFLAQYAHFIHCILNWPILACVFRVDRVVPYVEWLFTISFDSNAFTSAICKTECTRICHSLIWVILTTWKTKNHLTVWTHHQIFPLILLLNKYSVHYFSAILNGITDIWKYGIILLIFAWKKSDLDLFLSHNT